MLLVQLLRIRQYTKNLFVFAAPLFAGTLLHTDIFLRCMVDFISFCCVASAVYIFNDIQDREQDRRHPQKSQRPIACGRVSTRAAVVYALLLLSTGLIGAFLLASREELGLLLIYIFLNILYSLWGKYIVLLDVMLIAFGFVLRAFMGLYVIRAETTSWFLLCVFMLSLFLALGKRRAELETFGEDAIQQRGVLSGYSLAFIDQLLNIVAAMTMTSYTVFASQQEHGHGALVTPIFVTVPFVIYGIFRYLYLLHVKKQGGRPEEIFLRDKHIFITCMLFIACVLFLRNI